MNNNLFLFFKNVILNIKLNEGDTYPSKEAFISAIKVYAKQQDFQIHLGKVKKNTASQIQKRTILCNKEGFIKKILNNSRTRTSKIPPII